MPTARQYILFGLPACFAASYLTKTGIPLFVPASASTTTHGVHSLEPPAHIASSPRHKECVESLKRSALINSSSKSSTFSRDENIARMKRDHSSPDTPASFLIIGGGATGSSAALEAAARGFSDTVLVEASDWASGSSSKSTKLLHGGVRYLEKAFYELDPSQLNLVSESLRERRSLMSMAPHLCGEMGIFIPCYSRFELLWYRAGMAVYDAISWVGGSKFPTARIVSAEEVSKRFPALRHEQRSAVAPGAQADSANEQREMKRLVGAVEYFDGTFDDARLCLSMVLSAAVLGCAVSNYCVVDSLIKKKKKNDDEQQQQQIMGAMIRDTQTNEVFPVYARCVVNATGAACDSIRKMALDDDDDDGSPWTDDKCCISPSRGTHITLPHLLASSPSSSSFSSPALLIPKTDDGRLLFVEPWGGRCVVGTTDDPCPRPTAASSQTPQREEATWLLDHARQYLSVPVDESAIRSAWTGVRPLAVDPRVQRRGGAALSSKDIVRSHVVFSEPKTRGLVSVAGGKWTTANAMAVETMDAAMAAMEVDNHPMPAMSKYLKLVGATAVGIPPAQFHLLCAEAVDKLDAQLTKNSENGSFCNKDAVARHLSSSYGDRAFAVLDIVKNQQQQEKLQTLVCPALPNIILAEVVYAARHEMALTPMDFFARRTRAAFLESRGIANEPVIRRVATVMARENMRDAGDAARLAWVDKEVQRTLEQLKSEFSCSA